MVLRRPETSATNSFFLNLFNVFLSKKHVHHVFMSKKNMYLMSSCLNTIFAFLTLNTPRSAHNKIFGAKFLSFEQLELTS